MSDTGLKEGKLAFASTINRLVNDSDKTQVEIAGELGYGNQNIITMFKKGTTRVPLEKVVPFAKVLGVDPAVMLRDWFKAYVPEALPDIEEQMGMILTTEERSWIVNLRKAFDRVPTFDTTVLTKIKGIFSHA